jgi:hypothetical protein
VYWVGTDHFGDCPIKEYLVREAFVNVRQMASYLLNAADNPSFLPLHIIWYQDAKEAQFLKLDQKITRLTLSFGNSCFETLRCSVYCMKGFLGLNMNVTALKLNTAASSADLSSALYVIIIWEMWPLFKDEYRL